MQLGYVILAILILGLMGCRRSLDLPDLFQRSDFTKPFDEKLRLESNAPLIVVGRVASTRPVGRPKRSLGDVRLMVQLTEITIRVEDVLKGSSKGDPLDFYYYTFARENEHDLGIPRYLPIVSERRIYFLQPFDHRYRSVGDVADYTLPVKSGYHKPGMCHGKSTGCCIAEVLLMPGETYDPKSFAQNLVKSEYVASVLCSRSVALQLVEQLLHNPSEVVSRAASEILTDAQAKVQP